MPTRPRGPPSTAPVVAQPFEFAVSSILWPQLLGFTGDLLNLSEWTHIATLGRDHYVRIVYEGHLFPFGHRASLVKITERKIRDVPLADGSTTPLAYLVQRMFIVVRQPLRDYTVPEVHSQLENGGRGLPFKNIRLTTLVTPDIANPLGGSAHPLHHLFLLGAPGHRRLGRRRFQIPCHRRGYRRQPGRFHRLADLHPLRRGHARPPGGLRPLSIPAAKNAPWSSPAKRSPTRPPSPGGSNENTNLTTNALYFTNQPAPVQQDLRRFPAQAVQGQRQAARGGGAARQTRRHPDRLSRPLPEQRPRQPDRPVRLHRQGEPCPAYSTADKLLSEFSADKAGGFATPNLSISGLTSQLGPLAGDLANAASDVFKPDDFFNDVKDAAKLFGTFSLADLLEPLTMTAGAPKVQINKEDLAAPAAQGQVQADHHPGLDPGGQGAAAGHRHLPRRKNGDTKAKLEVHGRVEKMVELPPSGAPDPGYAKMDGSLTNFTIELLHVVEVLFEKFAFTLADRQEAGHHRRPRLGRRRCASSTTSQFVDELRKNIPAGLFGDGPSLDINATRVKAGFSLGLPPVAVGVFALKDVTIAAFIELPFLDGRPLFDFCLLQPRAPLQPDRGLPGRRRVLPPADRHRRASRCSKPPSSSAPAPPSTWAWPAAACTSWPASTSPCSAAPIDGKDVDAATLDGYLRMGGELSVLGLISVSLEFYLAFATKATGSNRTPTGAPP